MNNKIATIIKKLEFDEQYRPAKHIGWDEISDSASELLCEILGREITAESARSDYYYWSLDISKSPLVETEIEKLNSIAEADDTDLEIQSNNDFPMTEIDQGLSCKLLSMLVPFKVCASSADDDGVWFIGDFCDAGNLKAPA